MNGFWEGSLPLSKKEADVYSNIHYGKHRNVIWLTVSSSGTVAGFTLCDKTVPKPTSIIVRRALLALCLFVGPVWATSYSSCRSDLDDLKQRSNDAADKARETADAEDELEECRSSKGMAECRSKLDDYESAKDSLESALEDVASKVRAASSSCGFDLTQPISMANVKGRFCKALNRERTYLPPAVLFNECKKTMTDEECKKCLGIQ